MKAKDILKRPLVLSAALAALGAETLCALPAIDPDGVEVTQSRGSRLVTVKYTLTGDPAVVTVDFQTNNAAAGTWASIGGEKYARVAGDVNRLVKELGTTRTITWQPGDADAWPNQIVPGANFRAVVQAWATNHPPPYMIVDLEDIPGKTWYYPSAEAIPGGITNDIYKTRRLAFRLVPASHVQWRMGAPGTEKGQTVPAREKVHYVTFTNDYYMAVFPATQYQHKFYRGSSDTYPSMATNDMPATATYPVEGVYWANLRGWYWDGSGLYKGDWPQQGYELSWKSCITNLRNRVKIMSIDLPTDAQWEYACRAGTSTATYAGDLTVDSTDALDPALDRIAWYKANSGNVTHPVGLKEPNAWGFYDMIGNVWEMCRDKWDTANDGAVPAEDAIDPPGVTLETSWLRVVRGGSFSAGAYSCRSASRSSADRGNHYANIGYRLMCDAMALK